MLDPTPPLRRARPEDAAALAELVNMAGEGLPFYLWGKMAEPGQDPWEVGRQRALREQGGFSYRNATVIEAEGAVAGCLLGYALPDQPEPIDYASTPQMFVPMQELENLASATWYVNVLAVFPRHRGQGLGSRLLALADRIAVELRLRGLGVIVSDANAGARRLYQRCGYRETASRPMVKETWENPGRNWVLLVKQLPSSGG